MSRSRNGVATVFVLVTRVDVGFYRRMSGLHV